HLTLPLLYVFPLLSLLTPLALLPSGSAPVSSYTASPRVAGSVPSVPSARPPAARSAALLDSAALRAAGGLAEGTEGTEPATRGEDRKSTRLNSRQQITSYAVLFF